MYATVSVLGTGDALTRATLEQMNRLVAASIRNGDFVRRAVDVVGDTDGRNAGALASRIRAWMGAHLQFIRDPAVDGDVLRSPDYVMEDVRIRGIARVDCDDAATLGAALGRSVGLDARFVVVGFGSRSAPFSHVWAEVLTERGWTDLDTTAPPGLRARIPVTRRAYAPA